MLESGSGCAARSRVLLGVGLCLIAVYAWVVSPFGPEGKIMRYFRSAQKKSVALRLVDVAAPLGEKAESREESLCEDAARLRGEAARLLRPR